MLPLPACSSWEPGLPEAYLEPTRLAGRGGQGCALPRVPGPHAQGTAPTTYWLCGLGKTFTLSASESVKREHELNKIRVYVLSIYSVSGIPGPVWG